MDGGPSALLIMQEEPEVVRPTGMQLETLAVQNEGDHRPFINLRADGTLPPNLQRAYESFATGIIGSLILVIRVFLGPLMRTSSLSPKYPLRKEERQIHESRLYFL